MIDTGSFPVGTEVILTTTGGKILRLRVIEPRGRILRFDNVDAPGARYGLSRFAAVEVFFSKAKGFWLANIQGAPSEQAPVKSLEGVS